MSTVSTPVVTRLETIAALRARANSLRPDIRRGAREVVRQWVRHSAFWRAANVMLDELEKMVQAEPAFKAILADTYNLTEEEAERAIEQYFAAAVDSIETQLACIERAKGLGRLTSAEEAIRRIQAAWARLEACSKKTHASEERTAGFATAGVHSIIRSALIDLGSSKFGTRSLPDLEPEGFDRAVRLMASNFKMPAEEMRGLMLLQVGNELDELEGMLKRLEER